MSLRPTLSGEDVLHHAEVCGFNDWLIRMLQDYRCHKVILIQPDDRKKRKTDRRDAAALSELLWVNRDRLLQGKPVRGLRQVDIATSTDQENRRLTTLRKDAGRDRTRIINKIKQILRRYNWQWDLLELDDEDEDDEDRLDEELLELLDDELLLDELDEDRLDEDLLELLLDVRLDEELLELELDELLLDELDEDRLDEDEDEELLDEDDEDRLDDEKLLLDEELLDEDLLELLLDVWLDDEKLLLTGRGRTGRGRLRIGFPLGLY